MWHPGPGVVLDCIDYLSLPSFLLLLRLVQHQVIANTHECLLRAIVSGCNSNTCTLNHLRILAKVTTLDYPHEKA